MSDNPFCDHCTLVYTHSGEPFGKYLTINGVKVYSAIPAPGANCHDPRKAVLVLTDIFGHELVNARLLADDFSRAGFHTFIPGYLNDDSFYEGGGEALQTWFPRHGPQQTRPSLDAVISGLKALGYTSFAATGYCFGARYVFDLAFDHEVKAIAVSHPSLLQVPQDLEKIRDTGVHVLINSCEVDQQFPAEKQKLADEILGENGSTTGSKYKRTYYKGCAHGFAMRGDMSKTDEKAGKEGAFKETVQWFKAYL